MRVAFLVKVFPPSHETFILNQLRGLQARGIEIDVLAQRRGDMEGCGKDFTDVRVVYSSATGRFDAYWKAIRSRLNGLSERLTGRDAKLFANGCDYDLVHCQYATLGAVAVQLREAGVFDAPVVTSVRGFDITRRSAREVVGFDKLLACGELFLPVCDAFRYRLIELGVSPDRIRVHRSGIDIRKFRIGNGDGLHLPERPGGCFAQMESVPVSNPIRILSVARLVEKKGIEFAIRAVAQLIQQKHRVHCVKLTIIGDGLLRSELESLVNELGIATYVEFLGWLPHERVLEVMRQSQIVINPSVTAADGCQEGIPNTLKEAMAYGIPVIATRHSGIPELVDNGVSGLLVSERDSDGLAEAIARLIADPGLRKKMGVAGRRKVESEYDIQQLNGELVSSYQNIVSEYDQQRRLLPTSRKA